VPFSASFWPFWGPFAGFAGFWALQQGRWRPPFRALPGLGPFLGPFSALFGLFSAARRPAPGPLIFPLSFGLGLRPPAGGPKRGPQRGPKGPFWGPPLAPFWGPPAPKGALWPSGPHGGPLGLGAPLGPQGPPIGAPRCLGPGFGPLLTSFLGPFCGLFWPSVLASVCPAGPGSGRPLWPLFLPRFRALLGPKRPHFGPQNHRFSPCFT